MSKGESLSKIDIIAIHLFEIGSITSWEAIKKYRVTRLAAVIKALKDKGFPISDAWETNEDTGERYKRYFYAGS